MDRERVKRRRDGKVGVKDKKVGCGS